MGCVYLITCKVNGKQYFGATTETKDQRYARHRNANPKDYKGSIIQPAIKKHGQKNFIVEVVYSSNDWSELTIQEKYYIKKYNTKAPNDYNLTDGGDGTPGRKWNEIQAEVIPKAVKEHWSDPKRKEETITKIKEALAEPEVMEKLKKIGKDRWNIPGYKENFSKKSKASWAVPETKQKQSERSKKQWEDPKHKEVHLKRLSKMWGDPEFRKRMACPQMKAKRAAGIKKAWEEKRKSK